MKYRNFNERVEEDEFDYYQVLVSELDTSLPRMKFVSDKDLKDAFEIEQFNKFWNSVKSNEAVVVSITDNADLYELSEDCILIVLIENLNEKIFVFDMQDVKKIIRKILNFD